MNIDRISSLSLIAAKHHFGQVDLGGHPYFDHVERVARTLLEIGIERIVIAAYFHDFGEDVEGGREILKALPFTARELELIEGMDAGVVPSGMSYDRYYLTVYLPHIALDPELALIKLSDSYDNSDPDRLIDTSDKSVRRVFKYKIVIEYLVKSLEGTEFSLAKLRVLAPRFAKKIQDRLEYLDAFYVKHRDVLVNSGYAKIKNEFGM